MDTADFALRLHDQVSGPARKAKQSLAETESAMDKLRRASAMQDRANRSAMRQRLADRRREVAQQARLVERQKRATVEGQMGIVRHQMAVKRARQEAMSRLGVSPAGGGGGASAADMVSAIPGLGALAGPAAAIAALAVAVGAVTMAVVRMGEAFGSALFRAMDFGQRTQIALTSILKSGPLATQQFREVAKEAGQLGLDVFSTVDSFKMLANAGFDVATARQLVRMSADLQTLTGSSESAAFALRAISQIKMKGRLQAEEITGQLAEHGVSADAVYAELGKRLGKTRQEILKMQKAGEVSADMAIPAILQAVRNQLGTSRSGEFTQMVAQGSISGMINQVKGGMQFAMLELGREIAPHATAIAQKFFGTVQKIAASPAVAKARTRIVEMFSSAAEWVEQNWPRIEPMIINVANRLADGFSSAADFVMNHGEELRTMFMGAATVAGVLAAQLVILTGMVYAVAGGISYAIGTVAGWLGGAEKALGVVLAFVNPLARIAALWMAVGSAIDFVTEKFRQIPAKLQSIVLPVSVAGVGAQFGAGGQAASLPAASMPTGLGNVGALDPVLGGGDVTKQVTVYQTNNVSGADLSNPEKTSELLGPFVRRTLLGLLE